MKKSIMIFAFACFVALSSIICGNLCGRTSGETAVSSEITES